MSANEPEDETGTLASDNAGTPTPERVVELATRQATLPRVALIGIFGNDTARGALVREKSGEIRRVVVGDKAAGGIVSAIGEDRLIIARRRTSDVLALPDT